MNTTLIESEATVLEQFVEQGARADWRFANFPVKDDGLWEKGSLFAVFHAAIDETLEFVYAALGDACQAPPYLSAKQVLCEVEHDLHASGALNRATCLHLMQEDKDGMAALFSRIVGSEVRRLAIAPCSAALTPLLPQIIEAFDDVLLVDNFKAGQVIAGKTVEPLQTLLDDLDAWDGVFVPTPDDDVMRFFFDSIGCEKAFGLRRIVEQHALREPSSREREAYDGILREIAVARSPIVVFSGKVNVTMEPTLLALEKEGHEVFLVTRMTRFQDASVTEDADCPLRRNFVLPLSGFLHLVQNLKGAPAVLFYDFFLNFAWNARNAERAYAYVAALLRLAGSRMTLGCYDVIKPVCLNMEHHEAANAFYADMLDQAGGIWLNSKSEQIADYLRNTVARGKPVISFYRYGMPPQHRLMKLSQIDGERHIVGVTSFFGEVFEPNRLESGEFIRQMLRHQVHFHYYSNNRKVFEYQEALEENEKPYFHIHDHIWEQDRLAREMSQFDAGWLVGDEGPTFGMIVAQTKNRLARDLFALFVPNGVPTSSMTYGAAGLPVFASRAITILQGIFPPGCLIPLDLAEIASLPDILDSIDWAATHKIMANNSYRFDARQNVARLASYFDAF